MTTAVGFIMLAIIVILLLTNKTSIIPVFGIIPIVAALILGYGLKDIQGFMNNGFSSVLNTVVLFSFAVMFFSLLSDVGMFDVIVNRVMKYLGNNVLVVLYIACFVTVISHLDGSGATTASGHNSNYASIFKKDEDSPSMYCLCYVHHVWGYEHHTLVRLHASGNISYRPGCSGIVALFGTNSRVCYYSWPTPDDSSCYARKTQRCRYDRC